MPDRKLTPNQTAGGIGALCVAAAAACLSLTQASEGERLKPYKDPANIVTWCFGETEGKPKDRYTSAECAGLLRNRLAKDYAPKIAACVPQVANERRIKVFAALLDAAYNAGPDAVCKSPMRARIVAGDLAGSCSAYVGWYVTARYRGKPQPTAAMRKAGWTWTGKFWRKQLPGLVTRRQKEAALCRGGFA
jgi:lysozyme